MYGIHNKSPADEEVIEVLIAISHVSERLLLLLYYVFYDNTLYVLLLYHLSRCLYQKQTLFHLYIFLNI